MNRAERRRGTKLERAQGIDLEGITNNDPQALQDALNIIDANVRQQRLTKARKICDTALEANPQSSQLNYALGVVHQAKGDVNKAIHSYQQAVSTNPDNLAAWINLGICARSIKSNDTAIKAFNKALAIDSGSFHAHYNLALVHCDLKQMDEALSSLSAALEINPASPDARFQVGFLEELRTNHEAAITHYRELLKSHPNAEAAHTHAGACLQMIGKFEEGADHLKQAIELNPANGRAHFLLASSDQAMKDSGYLAQLVEQTRRRDVQMSDRINMHFAAGRMHERFADYDTAFDHYKTGNDLRKTVDAFDRNHLIDMAARMKAVFTPEYVSKLQAFGDPTMKPVFVVGIPKSGTTLVEQIIASHPQAYGAGELANFNKICGKPETQPGMESPDILENLTPEEVAGMVQRYLADYPEASSSAARVVDKTPGNAMWLGVLTAMFPNASFISCSRDPMDTLWSCYTQNFSTVVYACDFEDLATYHAIHRQTMDLWREVLSVKIHEVCYEDLVLDPATHIPRIIEAVGLPWDERCLDFHSYNRSVQTTSLWQVRKPMFASSIGKWKRFEPKIEPLKTALDAASAVA